MPTISERMDRETFEAILERFNTITDLLNPGYVTKWEMRRTCANYGLTAWDSNAICFNRGKANHP